MSAPALAPHAYTRDSWLPDPVAEAVRTFNPRTHLGAIIKRALAHLPPDMALELIDRYRSILVVESSLELTVVRSPDSRFWRGERIEQYGLVSYKLVTDAFVAALVDALDVGVGFTLSNFRYHGIGTGTTAEAQTQTALVTELTTEYTGNVRATGTATQPSANIYTSTGTNTLDSGTPALREHAVFTQAATGGGTMLDRSLFAAINLDGTVGDGLTSAYSLTCTAGG